MLNNFFIVLMRFLSFSRSWFHCYKRLVLFIYYRTQIIYWVCFKFTLTHLSVLLYAFSPKFSIFFCFFFIFQTKFIVIPILPQVCAVVALFL